MSGKFKNIFFFLLTSFFLLFASSAQAVCPVCTIAVSACVGLAQYFGIDDTITGVWIGGLIVSMALWTVSYFEKKNFQFKRRKIAILAFYYLIIIVPFYWKGLIGHPFNKIWTLDKLLVGIIIGSLFFFLSSALNSWLKKRNGDRVYFPFQKVAIPLAVLGLLSAVFYFLTC
jgi:hypothetical protein